jgi:hypothetical protein
MMDVGPVLTSSKVIRDVPISLYHVDVLLTFRGPHDKV